MDRSLHWSLQSLGATDKFVFQNLNYHFFRTEGFPDSVALHDSCMSDARIAKIRLCVSQLISSFFVF